MADGSGRAAAPLELLAAVVALAAGPMVPPLGAGWGAGFATVPFPASIWPNLRMVSSGAGIMGGMPGGLFSRDTAANASRISCVTTVAPAAAASLDPGGGALSGGVDAAVPLASGGGAL